MSSPTLKSDLSHSVAIERAKAGDPKGAVTAALDSILASQKAAARSRVSQAAYDWHAEEYDTDHMWGREDE